MEKKQNGVGQENNERSVVTLRIEPETFKGTKSSPVKEGVFSVYVEDGKLMVENTSKKQGANIQRYDYEAGQLNFVTKPNSVYAYFRSDRFQQFLDRNGINRVRHVDPNGEYQLRSGTYRNNFDTYMVFSDGENTISQSSSLAGEQEPIMGVRYANAFVNIENASFALIQQATVKTFDDAEPQVTFKLREIITKSNIYDLEKDVQEHIQAMNTALTSLVEQQSAKKN